MEQILFETAEMLMKYGFRRFMFFNYHGGNRIVESKVIHRINHTTEAIAVAIGHGSPIQKGRYQEKDSTEFQMDAKFLKGFEYERLCIKKERKE